MIRLCTSVLAVCLTVGMFSACANGGTQTRAEATTFVSLSINPEVEFTVSDENRVLSANAVNTDAEILLAETNLVGMNIELAAEKFVALSVEAGYLDVDKQSETKMTVVGENADVNAKIENSLETCINGYFDNNGIFGKVSKATLEQYATQATQLGVSVGHMKMILRAIDLNAEMTLEDLSKMPINELVKLIKTGHGKNELVHAVKEQLKIDRAALNAKYEEIFVLEDEANALKEQIEKFNGTAEEKAVLESELQAKNARIVELKAQYEAELRALNEKARADTVVAREEHKADRKEKIEKNKGFGKRFLENRKEKTHEKHEFRISIY